MQENHWPTKARSSDVQILVDARGQPLDVDMCPTPTTRFGWPTVVFQDSLKKLFDAYLLYRCNVDVRGRRPCQPVVWGGGAKVALSPSIQWSSIWRWTYNKKKSNENNNVSGGCDIQSRSFMGNSPGHPQVLARHCLQYTTDWKLLPRYLSTGREIWTSPGAWGQIGVGIPYPAEMCFLQSNVIWREMSTQATSGSID